VLQSRDLIHRLAAPFRLDGSNGEAFVLVHGFTGNPAHFRHLGGQLNNHGYTINAPLLPGHATRFEDLGTVTRHDWIEATLDAVREVGDHHRTHLVGLSMGGLLSIVAADRTSVATLTTIDSPVRFRDKRVYLSRFAHFRTPEVRWAEEPMPELDEEVAGYWIHAEGFPTVAASEMLSLSRYARRVARRVSIPSLVIQSRTDETVHPSSGPLLKTALGPACRLLWLENSMHNALFDRERDVIRDAVLELVGR
jgi:carboxylesterase